jgi:hypothetical protein
MTQALNLANFANNLNTGGATSNAGLQNSSVTVTAGTGMSGGGAVALGSSVTLTNAGVTSIVAGTGVTISGSTGAVTVNATGTGTVTSVATNNGLTGGTITSSGTIGIDVYNGSTYNYSSYAIGTTIMVGFCPSVNVNTTVGISIASAGQAVFYQTSGGPPYGGTPTAMSGTWRARGVVIGCGTNALLATRTA